MFTDLRHESDYNVTGIAQNDPRRRPMSSPLQRFNSLAGAVRDSVSSLKHPSGQSKRAKSPRTARPRQICPQPAVDVSMTTESTVTGALSAIHQTPPELWTQILSYLAPSTVGPVRPGDHPALPLSQVSSHLRALTHDTPFLWSSLAIAREDYEKSPDNYLAFVSAWLRRSNGRELSLSLSWVPFDTASPLELLDIINIHAANIQHLHLSVAAPTLKLILSYQLPKLTSLSLAIRVPLPRDDGVLCPNAPNLRKVELLGPYQNPSNLGLPLAQLTDLSAQFPMQSAPALALLAQAPRLKTAALRVAAPPSMLMPYNPNVNNDDDDDDDDNNFALPTSPVLGGNGPPVLTSLSRLTSLTITSEHAGPLLASLHAPALNELSLISIDRRQGINWPSLQVANLLSPLQKLTVKGRKVKVGGMQKIFRNCPDLGDVEVEWKEGMEDAGERLLADRRRELESRAMDCD